MTRSRPLRSLAAVLTLAGCHVAAPPPSAANARAAPVFALEHAAAIQEYVTGFAGIAGERQ